MSKIFYLTAKEIKEVNKILGCNGVISEGNLEFTVAKIEDLDTTIENKAITLLYDLIISHPFLDCNKRTSFVSMQIFLNRNGKELEYSKSNEDLLKKLLYDIADNKITYGVVERLIIKMIT